MSQEEEPETSAGEPADAETTAGSEKPAPVGFWRKLRKRMAQFLVVLVVLIIAFLIFSQTSTFRDDILKPQVEAATNNALQGTLEIGVLFRVR